MSIIVAGTYSYELPVTLASLDKDGDLCQFNISFWMDGVPEFYGNPTYTGSQWYSFPGELNELWLAELSMLQQLALNDLLTGWGELFIEKAAVGGGRIKEPAESATGFA